MSEVITSEAKKSYDAARAKISERASSSKSEVISRINLIKNEIYKGINSINER